MTASHTPIAPTPVAFTAARTVALSDQLRPLLASRLPDGLTPRWWSGPDDALAMAPEVDIGWFDMQDTRAMARAICAATRMRWLNSIYAGLDHLPLPVLVERGVRVTNGAGINAITIAEYVVMGMLNIAKGYREVVRAQDRHEWLADAPGRQELYGSKALILGYGAIGKLVAERLMPFGVGVTAVRRSVAAPEISSEISFGKSAHTVQNSIQTLGSDQWRARLTEFDWVILAVPATASTEHMIGVAELAAMKKSAVLINVARGSVVDQAALMTALQDKTIAAAFLDVTTPEPLPADHGLWALPNAHVTMHLSGRSQSLMFQRSAERFLQNLARYQAGQPLMHQADLALGY